MVHEIRQGTIGAGDTGNWEDVELAIPPIPTSGMYNCGLIDMEYYYKVKIHTKSLF